MKNSIPDNFCNECNNKLSEYCLRVNFDNYVVQNTVLYTLSSIFLLVICSFALLFILYFSYFLFKKIIFRFSDKSEDYHKNELDFDENGRDESREFERNNF
jgi:hypothetical protein